MPMPANHPEDLWNRVDRSDPNVCWPWPGQRSSRGYGYWRVEGRQWAVHRLAYELEIGPIQKGMYVCHHCDNPPCINPAHLFQGTAQDNFMDAFDKGRISDRWGEHRGVSPEKQPRGERHGRAKLTEAQVVEIINRLRAGGSRGLETAIAQEFGVSLSLVSAIAHRKRWAHLWQALGEEAAA